MKVELIGGALPVLVLKSKDPHGHARGPVVWLPPNCDPAMRAHEFWHVRQFYAVWPPFVALLWVVLEFMPPTDYALAVLTVPQLLLAFAWNSKRWRWRREVAAFAEKIRHHVDREPHRMTHYINRYAGALLDIYGFSHVSASETRAALRERYASYSLF